uniref:Uncharacterized protein n=1 Tax=Pithovirus LCDPAC01 TaxID=2506600 RepID=A0A481YMZ3_9VIRU|nr:MAG: hypothetical protein LCDPAC01_01360 [Pithovirus LCDPAC01]
MEEPKTFNADLSGILIDDIGRDGKDWDDSAHETVHVWKNEMKKLECTYDYVLDSLQASIECYHTLSIAIGTMAIICGAIGYNYDNTTTRGFAIQIMTFVLTTLSTLFMGFTKRKTKLSRIKELSGYIIRISTFISVLSTELTLPLKLRKNANEFLITLTPTYKGIIAKKPNLTSSEDKESSEHYYRNNTVRLAL